MTPTDFPGSSPSWDVARMVGAYVHGSPQSARTVVRWLDQLTAAQELDNRHTPEAEQYLSAFAYPQAEYLAHFRRVGSPRGYTGPASCPFLLFDIDRDDLEAARLDAGKLVRFLVQRYGILEAGLGIWFSGNKGFHIGLECLPGYAPSPQVPAVARRLALALAHAAGVRIDPAIYDHQRLFRLPNSKHSRSGLYKRPLTLEELHGVNAAGIRALAEHPAEQDLPIAAEHCEALEADWLTARETIGQVTPAGRVAPSSAPVVPKFVRDFIGFREVADPGRAVTLFRCAAALAEAGTPPAVVRGLLEEVALKSGLPTEEVEKQLHDGIQHGQRAGRGVA